MKNSFDKSNIVSQQERDAVRNFIAKSKMNMYREGGPHQYPPISYPDGGQIYTYSGNPNASYKKVGDQWYISNKGTGNKFVPIQDPDGNRTAELNKNAVLLPGQPAPVETPRPVQGAPKPRPISPVTREQELATIKNSPVIADQRRAYDLEGQLRHRDIYYPEAFTGDNPDNIEGVVNEALGYPMAKAIVSAEAASNEGQVDNYRHANAGRYTAEAIKDMTGNIPYLSDAAAIIGANAFGLGHELNTYFTKPDDRPWSIKLRETGEDMYNNFIGTTVGVSDLTPEEKTDELLRMSYSNELPDGIVSPHKKINRYFKHSPTDPGKYKGSYAEGGASGCPPGYTKVNGRCVNTRQWQDVPEKNKSKSKKVQPFVTSDSKEYAFRKAAYDDSLNLYNLNKDYRNANDDYFLKNWKQHIQSSPQNEKAADNAWKNFGVASDKLRSYKKKSKVENKPSGSYTTYGSGVAGGYGNINVNAPGIKVLKRDGSFVLTSRTGERGYQKPVQPVIFQKETKTDNTKKPVPPGKTYQGDYTESVTLNPETGEIVTIKEPIYEDRLPIREPERGSLQPFVKTNYPPPPPPYHGVEPNIQGNEVPMYATPDSGAEFVPQTERYIDWNGNSIGFNGVRFRKPGHGGDLIKKGRRHYLHYPSVETRNSGYIVPEEEFAMGGYIHQYPDGGPKRKIARFIPGTYDPNETAGYELTEQEVNVPVKASNWGKAAINYEKRNPEEEFIENKKRKYLKRNKGLNEAMGVDMENFPEDVEANFRNEYDYKKNTAVVKKVGKQEGWNPNKRTDYVDQLNDTQRGIVAESKYGSKLQPSYWDRSLAGLATFASKFSPEMRDAMNKGYMPGLTQKESQEILNSKMTKIPFTDINLPFAVPIGGLESLAGLEIPGVLPANYVKNTGLTTGSNYKEMPSWYNGEKMANVEDKDVMSFNPVTYAGLEAIPELGVKAIKSGYNALKASKEAGLLSNTYKLNPFAFEPKSNAYYRMIGEEGYADALNTGVVRPPQTTRIFDQSSQKYVDIPIPQFDQAYYNAQYPLDRRWYPNSIKKTNPEKAINAKKAGYKGPYMAEVTGDSHLFEKGENVAAYTGPNSFQTVTYSKEHIPITNTNLKFYKEHWLHGYKEVPRELPSSPNASNLESGLANSTIYPTETIPVAAITPPVQIAKPIWQSQELPGLHLKSTMTDGAVSKIVEPKTGLINTEQALGIIAKEFGGSEKVAMIKQALGETIPKKMDYNDFRKLVQDQLIPLEKQLVDHSSAFGLERIGYGYDMNSTGTINDAELLENQTIIFSNKNEFGRGSDAHSNPEETLGHVHFFRDSESPDALTISQLQSDAFQGTHRVMPKNIDEAFQKVNSLKEEGKEIKSMFGDGKESSNSVLANYEKHLQLEEASAKNFTQKQLLDKNHQERYIQEIVKYAAERGDINRIRIPTSETAAKIQGYFKTPISDQEEMMLLRQNIVDAVDSGDRNLINKANKVYDDAIKEATAKGKMDYNSSSKTILKKYSEQPKIIKKLYGVEPKIVTDGKGNTWYEFNIPYEFKHGPGEIKAFKKGGSNQSINRYAEGGTPIPDMRSQLNNAKTFGEAFGIARNSMGANQIFEWNGKKYGTNLKGETFTPSDEVISASGLNVNQYKKRIDQQNKQVDSPFVSTSTVKLEPEYEDWNTVKQRTHEINKNDNANKIIQYQNLKPSDKNYVIVDKQKGLLHIYQPGVDKPLYSAPIDLGAMPGDAQTVTKYKDINKDGKISPNEMKKGNVDWNAGNLQTGAGKYYISNIDPRGYEGLPILNMMNEKQYGEFLKTGNIENVSTSFHKGYVSDDESRVSNGCIRCNKTSLDNLVKYLGNSSEVYVLPEEKNNEFILQNDKLVYKNKVKSPYYNYSGNPEAVYKKQNDKWFIEDKKTHRFIPINDPKGTRTKELNKNAMNLGYNIYEDKNGIVRKGQGANSTIETLKYVPIKLDLDENTFVADKYQTTGSNMLNQLSTKTNAPELQNVKKYVSALETNKQKIMKAAQINGDVYNEIARMAFGILGVESNFADVHDPISNFGRAIHKYIDPTNASSPDYQSKYNTYGAKENTHSVGPTQLRWSYLNDKEKNVLKQLGITSNAALMNPEKAALATAAILGVRYNEQLNDSQKKDMWKYLPTKWNTRDNYAARVKQAARYLSVKQKNTKV